MVKTRSQEVAAGCSWVAGNRCKRSRVDGVADEAALHNKAT